MNRADAAARVVVAVPATIGVCAKRRRGRPAPTRAELNLTIGSWDHPKISIPASTLASHIRGTFVSRLWEAVVSISRGELLRWNFEARVPFGDTPRRTTIAVWNG